MEKDDEISGEGNSYDFGARMYDSRLGRWLTIDPFTEKYPSYSSYSFCNDSPLRFVDPDGRKIKPARIEDVQEVKDYIYSFDISHTDRKGVTTTYTATDLFQIKTNVNFEDDVTYSTELTEAAFKKNLRKAKKMGMGKEQREAAWQTYRMLKSDQIYEIGVVDET